RPRVSVAIRPQMTVRQRSRSLYFRDTTFASRPPPPTVFSALFLPRHGRNIGAGFGGSPHHSTFDPCQIVDETEARIATPRGIKEALRSDTGRGSRAAEDGAQGSGPGRRPEGHHRGARRPVDEARRGRQVSPLATFSAAGRCSTIGVGCVRLP